MAKLERTFHGKNFDQVLQRIENAVLNGSISATLEDASNFNTGEARCAVRVFERYSHMGGNRVSMNVTLFQSGELIYMTAITSGGSQAMFWKVNTWGEETFLDTLSSLFE